MSPVILDVNSFELAPIEREMLQHPLCGGLILFSRNYAEKAQLSALIKDIRRTVKKPFLIAVDHEGGRVQRFRDGFTHIPAMSKIEKYEVTQQEQFRLANAMGFCMAYELMQLDIDISYAPVLDLNGISEVIGSRAFSSDVDEVITLSTKYIEGMHQAGMKSTGKHFPGHGSVCEDSHIAMPVDSRSFEHIQTKDMRVFTELIKAKKVDAIMPAHVIYSDVDDKPAGFSEVWLKQILRKQLGFEGVIFSDDLTMQAASIAGSVTERAEIAIEAGCDMVLVCNAPTEAEKVLDGLSQTKVYSQRWHNLLLQDKTKLTLDQPKMKLKYSESTKIINKANELFS
ncbi:MAG: beta-N-acetylhexosaminidase [Glaciecola sp.]|jgi:beta-N-acetylhexosaminidase|mmetsp:Transcript_54702/g.173729  ORF Transcript_54702/g.173729 Transcript_54702/m.173729 type:complete len:341 (+) Transcript_54702:36-1058(+)